ncbi:hypothetical protein AALA80_19430, partial [Oscillospiraceae bacterium 50-60]
SFSFETTKDTAGCRAFYRNFIVGDFLRSKKYYSALDGLDRRNGDCFQRGDLLYLQMRNCF